MAPPLTPKTLKLNPFLARASLLNSIDLGFLKTSASQNPEERTFDAEFHPQSNESSHLVQSTVITQTSVGSSLTASTIRSTSPLQSCHPVLYSNDATPPQPTQTRTIPIRLRPPSSLQSPTLISKPVGLSDEKQIERMLRPERSRSKEGGRDSVPPCPFLSRSAIAPPSALMSTSAPSQRNPMLRGRSCAESPGEVFFPA